MKYLQIPSNETCQVDQENIHRKWKIFVIFCLPFLYIFISYEDLLYCRRVMGNKNWKEKFLRNINARTSYSICIMVNSTAEKQKKKFRLPLSAAEWKECKERKFPFSIFRLFPCPICVENVTESQTIENVLLFCWFFFFSYTFSHFHPTWFFFLFISVDSFSDLSFVPLS